MIQTQDIKALREKTGASISEVRKALIEAEGDQASALKILEHSLGAMALKKGERSTKEGVIDCYIHSDRKIGVLIEMLCETDFVARTSEFQGLAHDVALHIAAMNPLYISPDDIPQNVIEDERRLIEEEARKLVKPKEVMEQIISGKLQSHFNEVSLLKQAFVKNPDKTVDEVVREASGKLGENIRIGRFTRFSL